MAFRNSSGGGISCIDVECIEKGNRTICEHIREFYAKVHGEPVVYFIFSYDDLPPEVSIVFRPSVSGDNCHRDLENFTNNKSKRFFKTHSPGKLKVCINSTATDFSPSHLLNKSI